MKKEKPYRKNCRKDRITIIQNFMHCTGILLKLVNVTHFGLQLRELKEQNWKTQVNEDVILREIFPDGAPV